MADHSDFAGLIPDVIGRYGYWPTSEPEPVLSGTLNWNFKVGTDGGPFFVRRHRDDLETARIQGEHALVAWAEARGVPAPLPEETPEGQTIIKMGTGRWSMYPWIDGELSVRGALTAQQVRTLGALHGFTQATLAKHPESAGQPLQMRWDKAQSVELLKRIATVAAESGADSELQVAVTNQLKRLEAMEVLPPEAFATLPVQLIHGDFHDHQVLWQEDSIAALVDWEIWHADPRVWEVVRSLAFSQLLGGPLMEEYLLGYRDHVQLTEDECRLGLRMWWQSRVVGVWAWAAYFLQGNTRVARFFPEMIAESERIADDGWTSGINERFVRAACG
ncbi:MAG: phosphotransferase [bacterium]